MGSDLGLGPHKCTFSQYPRALQICAPPHLLCKATVEYLGKGSPWAARKGQVWVCPHKCTFSQFKRFSDFSLLPPPIYIAWLHWGLSGRDPLGLQEGEPPCLGSDLGLDPHKCTLSYYSRGLQICAPPNLHCMTTLVNFAKGSS